MRTFMAKIMIIGADSYLGARLYFDLSKKFDVIGTYYSLKLSDKFLYLDITNQKEADCIITKQKPDIIIHAANNASPKWCQENQNEAIEINQNSTKHIIDAAQKVSSKIIYISSIMAILPNDVYSKTKVASEKMIINSGIRYLIIRPSWILGFSPNTVNDRPFNRFLRDLDKKNKSAIYDDQNKFQPTYIGHISEVISVAIEKNIWNQTIIVAADSVKSRFDLAKDIIGHFGIKITANNASEITQIPVDNDIDKLKILGFPIYSYDEIISKIIDEIKNRDKFKL